MKKKNTERMKRYSRLISVLSGIFASIYGILFVVVLILGGVTTYGVNKMEFKDDKYVFFDEEYSLDELREELSLDALEFVAYDELFDKFANNSNSKNAAMIGSIFGVSAIAFLLNTIIMSRIKKFFRNVGNEKVFVEENYNHIRVVASLLVGLVLLSIACEIIFSFGFGLLITFDFSSLYLALLVAAIALIFKYGIDNIKTKKVKDTE